MASKARSAIKISPIAYSVQPLYDEGERRIIAMPMASKHCAPELYAITLLIGKSLEVLYATDLRSAAASLKRITKENKHLYAYVCSKLQFLGTIPNPELLESLREEIKYQLGAKLDEQE